MKNNQNGFERMLGTAPVTAFTIVIGKDAGIDIRSAAKRLRAQLLADRAEDAALLPIVTDEAPRAAHEIVLGKTDREQTEPALYDYSAFMRDGSLYFCGGHYAGVLQAVEAFLAVYGNGTAVPEDYSACGKVDEQVLPLTWKDTGAAISFMNCDLSKFSDITKNGGEYRLVWNDEFNGDRLDLNKWMEDDRLDFTKFHVQNRFDSDVIRVQDGKLVLETHIFDAINNRVLDHRNLPEGYTTEGGDGNVDMIDRIKDPQGRIVWEKGSPENYYRTATSPTTWKSMNFVYGYLEMKAEVPFHHRGEFPSFWLVGGGDLTGEIFAPKAKGAQYRPETDIFENFSTANTLETCLHKWYFDHSLPVHYAFSKGCQSTLAIYHNDECPSRDSYKGSYTFPEDQDPSASHTYGFLWTQDIMAFSVDGKFYCTLDLHVDFQTGENKGMEEWGWNQSEKTFSQFIILNNQLNSEKRYQEELKRPNEIVDLTTFPMTYKVDYMRLYQLPDSYGLLKTKEI